MDIGKEGKLSFSIPVEIKIPENIQLPEGYKFIETDLVDAYATVLGVLAALLLERISPDQLQRDMRERLTNFTLTESQRAIALKLVDNIAEREMARKPGS